MGVLDILSSIRDRADKFLNEKNVVTDFLGKIEDKTGIKKKIIAAGTSADRHSIINTLYFFHCVHISVCLNLPVMC